MVAPAVPNSQRLDRVFGALADPTRREILDRVSTTAATVNEIVSWFSLSQPTISRHIKVLEEAGLVMRSKDAQFRPVRLNPATMAEAAQWIGTYQQYWEQTFDNLDRYVQSLVTRKEEP